jgi:predicted Zn-dependent protease with MMP-like domain
MPVDWPTLLELARVEVNTVVRSLPRDLRAEAGLVPVTLEKRPGDTLREDGVEVDTLGLFVGEPFSETGTTTAPLPAQIVLFLENIWETAGADEQAYREEVRATFLHELGHYLGLDEVDLEERGLD